MSDFIFLMDQHENIIGHLTNEAPKGCPYYGDVLKEDEETGAQTYEFYVPADHPMARNILENGFIVRSGFHEGMLQFQISRVEEVHEGGILHKYIFCEFAWAELNGEIIRPYNLPTVDMRTAATHALTGTRWQPGIIDFMGNADMASDSYDTALKMLQDIKETFGAKIRFRVAMENNKITGRYVDLLASQGENGGLLITFGKNLTDAKRIHDRTTVATALIGLGRGDESADQITFRNVAWSKAKGHPVDKPAGQDWIGDEEARERWGIQGRHITQVFEYNTTSPDVLIRKTWDELQRIKNGVLQYEAGAAFLGRQDFDWVGANIGDTVTIQDFEFNPPLMVSARIIQLERSFTDPESNTATFGEYEPLFSTASNIADIQSRLLRKETQWETVPDIGEIELPENIAEVIRTPTEPERRANIIWIDPATPDRPFDLIKTWDVDAQTWRVSQPMDPADLGAENIILKQTTAPAHQNGRLWLDTSKIPNVMYRSDGKQWIRVTPTSPGDIGAETPDSAMNKAKVQGYRSMKNAVVTATTEALNRGQIILDNSSYYTSAIVSNIRAALQTVTSQSNALQTSIDNAISDGILTATEENNISTLKAQFDSAISTATYYIQQSAQDAGGLRVGTITGITLNVTQAGMTNDSGQTDPVRIWAGDTFQYRNNAEFRVLQSGAVYASNMNITGGSINISKNATVGNYLYLGDLNSYTYKYIYFNQSNYFGSDGSKFDFMGNLLWNTSGWTFDVSASAYFDGGSNYMSISAGTLSLAASTTVTKTLNANSTFNANSNSYFYGSVSFYGQPTFSYGGNSYTYYNGEFITGNTEQGFCGTGAFNPSSGGTGGSVSGTGVNFRIKKNYVPGSIQLSTYSSNVNGSSNFAAIDISQNGFWLYVNGASRTGQFVYWRGTYRA